MRTCVQFPKFMVAIILTCTTATHKVIASAVQAFSANQQMLALVNPTMRVPKQESASAPSCVPRSGALSGVFQTPTKSQRTESCDDGSTHHYPSPQASEPGPATSEQGLEGCWCVADPLPAPTAELRGKNLVQF